MGGEIHVKRVGNSIIIARYSSGRCYIELSYQDKNGDIHEFLSSNLLRTRPIYKIKMMEDADSDLINRLNHMLACNIPEDKKYFACILALGSSCFIGNDISFSIGDDKFIIVSKTFGDNSTHKRVYCYTGDGLLEVQNTKFDNIETINISEIRNTIIEHGIIYSPCEDMLINRSVRVMNENIDYVLINGRIILRATNEELNKAEESIKNIDNMRKKIGKGAGKSTIDEIRKLSPKQLLNITI